MIGQYNIDKSIIELGANVNLLWYTVYKQLGLGKLKPTPVILQLVGRSVHPKRAIEGILMQIDNFYFSIGFIVINNATVTNACL